MSKMLQAVCDAAFKRFYLFVNFLYFLHIVINLPD